MANHQSLKRVTVHEQIASLLRDGLAACSQPGDRFPSQNELARRFQVSPNTAREAVAQLVQEGLLERRFGSGTYVTGARPDKFIGVLTELDIAHPLLSSYFPQVIQSVRRHLGVAGWLTRLYVGHTRPYGEPPPARVTSDEFWIDLEANRLLGVVLVGSDRGILANAPATVNLPVFEAGSPGGRPMLDGAAFVRLGVDYLVDHGCQRVACLALSQDARRTPELDEFLGEVRRRGLVAQPTWTAAASLAGNPEESPTAVFRRLWGSAAEKPDGLLVLDDMLYRDLAPMLLYNGIRVPDDLCVISHVNRHDSRPMVPEPARLEIDPDEAGQVLAAHVGASLRGLDAAPLGLPLRIHVVEPQPSTMALESARR